jgi:hypothetical protein
MPTNCRTLIEAAYSRSTFNDPEKLATKSELIGVIDRRMKQLYSVIARENPTYFGTRATMSSTNGTWERPNNPPAELIHRVETSDGTQVHITPFDDRKGEQPPAVYQYGQQYHTVGRTNDPAQNAALTFFYSKRHPDLDPDKTPEHQDNQLDPMWPEQFNDLVVLHVARYLATKDGREGEIQVLAAEEQALMEVLFNHLRVENYGMTARWGQRARLISERPEGFRGE